MQKSGNRSLKTKEGDSACTIALHLFSLLISGNLYREASFLVLHCINPKSNTYCFGLILTHRFSELDFVG